MLRRNVESGFEDDVGCMVIGKARDDVSREQCCPTHSPLLESSIAYQHKPRANGGVKRSHSRNNGRHPLRYRELSPANSADDSFNAPDGKDGYTGGLY